MYLGRFIYEIRLFDSYSLKDKRSVSKSIISKVQNKFNLSCCQLDDGGKTNQLILACALVTGRRSMLRQTYDRVLAFIEGNYDVEVYESSLEEF